MQLSILILYGLFDGGMRTIICFQKDKQKITQRNLFPTVVSKTVLENI